MGVSALLAMAYAIACLGVIGFQAALIAGAPWGRLTQGGGREGPLSPAGRAFAGVSAGLNAAMALAVLSAAGLWPGWPAWTGWAALGLQAVVVVLNLITRSAPERRLWAPITAAMLALAAGVVVPAG